MPCYKWLWLCPYESRSILCTTINIFWLFESFHQISSFRFADERWTMINFLHSPQAKHLYTSIHSAIDIHIAQSRMASLLPICKRNGFNCESSTQASSDLAEHYPDCKCSIYQLMLCVCVLSTFFGITLRSRGENTMETRWNTMNNGLNKVKIHKQSKHAWISFINKKQKV